MKVTVLKDFLVAVDDLGVKTRSLVAGTVDEIADDLVPGLVDEGYVSIASDEAVLTGDGTGAALPPIVEPVVEMVAPAVEIPAEWQKLHHKTRVALAKKISGVDGLTVEQADKIIADEVSRRAAAPPASDEE